MSLTSLTKHEAVPVNIADTAIYCESFKASAVRSISEESTVDGGSVFTNMACRSTKLSFSGRLIADDSGDFIYSFNALIKGGDCFDVEYMGLSFVNCHMLSYTLDSKGEDWAAVSVTLISNDDIQRSDEV